MKVSGENIDIEISASSANAVSEITKLQAALSQLKRAASIKTANFAKVADGIRQISSAAKDMEDRIGALAKTASALERLSNLKTVTIPKSIGDGIRNIGLASESLSTQAVENIERITKALQRLSNLDSETLKSLRYFTGKKQSAKTQQAAESMDDDGEQEKSRFSKLFESFKEINNQILKQDSLWKDLWEKTKTFASGAARGVSFVWKTALQNIKADLVEFKNAFAPIGEAIKSRLQPAFESVANFAKSAFQKIKDAIPEGMFSRIGEGLQKAAFTILQPISLVVKGLGMIAKAAGQAAAAVAKIAGTIGGVLMKVVGVAGKALLSFGKTMLNVFAMPFKKAASGASNFVKKIGQLGAAFKRILFYRAIRTLIKEIGDAFREGTQNLYYYSQGINGQFSKSMDMAATSMLYFKNSIGAAVAPLVNALAPVLDMIVDRVVSVINVINQLMAKLTGAASWTRAVKYPKAYGDAMSGAGKAAKEAAKYLAPFDELNVLPSDNAGSGGGGGAAEDYASMFEEMSEFNSGISEFAESLKKAVSESDWEGLGKLLGEKVNEVVDMIGWGQIGSKIGYYINAWFTTKYWTLKTINFNNIGKQIATLLNKTLEQIDFTTIGRLFTRGFTLVGDFIIGAIQNVDWGLVGQSLGDFFRGAFDEASEWLLEQDWSGIGSNLWQSFKDLIDRIDFASLAKSFFNLLGTALGAAVQLIWGFVGGIWDDINGYFQKYLTNDDGTKKSGKDWVMGVLEGIWDAIKNVGTWIYDNVLKPIVDGFKNAFGIHSPSTVMKEQGGFVGEGILDGIAGVFKSIGTWIQTNVFDPIVNGIKNVFGIKNNTSDETKGVGKSIAQGIWDGISQKWKDIKEWWSKLKLGEFKIKKPHLSWYTEPASGWVAKVLETLGLPSSIPKLHVDWYAKGGIIDKASLIGAGEAGAEAIVPLERNTQWIDMVASRLYDKNRQGNYGSDLADDLEDANGVVVSAIMTATAEIVKAMQNNGGKNNGTVDIDKIARQVTRWQNSRARATGF